MVHDPHIYSIGPLKSKMMLTSFALSEAWDPEFRHHPSVLGLILGTGVGGGFVIDGKVLSGKNGIAGEIGHMNLNVDADNVIGETMPKIICGCGKKRVLKPIYLVVALSVCIKPSMMHHKEPLILNNIMQGMQKHKNMLIAI